MKKFSKYTKADLSAELEKLEVPVSEDATNDEMREAIKDEVVKRYLNGDFSAPVVNEAPEQVVDDVKISVLMTTRGPQYAQGYKDALRGK